MMPPWVFEMGLFFFIAFTPIADTTGDLEREI